MSQLRIGAHVSASGGLYNCFVNAKNIGAQAIQIFGSSPQQWLTQPLRPEALDKFLEEKSKASSPPVYLHAGYLANLASPKPEIRQKSVKSLSEHYLLAQKLEAEGLIFHLGSSGDGTVEAGIKNLITGIREVLEKVPGSARLILENSAGGGNKLGSTLEQLSPIYKGVGSPRAKLCLDTAQAFEAGLIDYESTATVKKFFDKFDKLIGLDKLEVLHSNDSKTVFNSHHDRHENIGKGYIGKKGFTNLAKEKRLHSKVWLLEVPGLDNEGPDKTNIKALASYF